MSLGQAVRTERRRQGLSQTKLAEAADISKRTVIALEQDENVTRDVIESVARVLGLRELPLNDLKLTSAAAFPSRELILSDLANINNWLLAAQGSVNRARGRVAVSTAQPLVEGMVADAPAASPLKFPKRRIPDIFSGSPLPIDSPVQPIAPDEFDEEEENLCKVEGRVAAGTGIEYIDLDETVWVPRSIVPRLEKDEHILKVVGESMIEFEINDGDYVVVQRRKGGVAAKREVVIGWLITDTHEGMVVKRWWREPGKRMLISGNASHPPIELKEGDTFELQGIVRYAFTRRRLQIRAFTKISG